MYAHKFYYKYVYGTGRRGEYADRIYTVLYCLLFFSKIHFYAGDRDGVVAIATRYGDRIPVGAKFSAPVQTGLGAHPSS